MVKRVKKSDKRPPPAWGPPLIPRELSQLALVERVLAQAADPAVPLGERLRYIGIVSSILDEFYEIRIIDLYDAVREAGGRGPAVPLYEQVSARAHRIVSEMYALFNHVVSPLLVERGVVVLNHAQRGPAQSAWVQEYFTREVRPLLAPIVLDPSHPFPQVMNKALNFVIQLEGKDAFGRPAGVAILKVPRVLPRVIPLPARLAPGRQAFVLLSSVIRSHLHEVFPGLRIASFSQFRVTRDSDLAVDEREVKNLRQALRLELNQRHYGDPVRLEVLNTCPPPLEQLLQAQFGLPDEAVFRLDGPVNLVRMNQLVDQLADARLRWPPFVPGWPERLAPEDDVFDALRAGDVLLHHPYQSFEPVLALLRQAATDEAVVAIRMTLYRTGSSSVLVDLLIEAARRGKEVTVVVELKARFDEEANIDLADRLERVGVQVVYGVVGLKTHAKMLLVTRRERARGRTRLARYAHLGTGNYHAGTARLYTDFGLLTANPDLCGDAEKVFRHLTSLTRVERLKHFWLAPFDLHKRLVEAIAREARHARSGKPARIVARMNALGEESIIHALYAASQAGVKIDLIVRGACALRPGVKGLSDNIRVRSVIGRFLEHSRVFWFRNGGADDVYLSSADWLGRNLFRRIEIAWPVLDPVLKRRVIDEGLKCYLDDRANAWQLRSDGEYAAPPGGARALPAQTRLIERLSQGEA